MSHPQNCFCDICRGDSHETLLEWEPSQPSPSPSETPSGTSSNWNWDPPVEEPPEEELKELPQLCADVKGMIRWITATARLTAQGETKTMLPKPTGQAQGTPSRGGAGMTYLKPEHLAGGAKDATILGVRFNPQGKFGPTVVVKLLLDGFTYFWNVNIEKNPNYPALVQYLGEDENAWVKRHLTLDLERDEFSGNMNIRATPGEDRAKAGRDTSRSR